MRYIQYFVFLFLSVSARATNYYVGPNGSDNKSGTSLSNAFRTLQKASDQTAPGDSVFIMAGTYTTSVSGGNILNIYHSGTASNWIVYRNWPGDSPVIKMHEHWAGIQIQGARYITIDGLNVIGNNDEISIAFAMAQKNNLNNPATSGNGIGCAPEYNNTSNRSHHIIIRNCNVTKCGGGGIYTNQADYIQILSNDISECGWYSPYGNSGISMYQNWNSDNSNGIKNYITGNTCYRNEEYIPFFAAGRISDGNGIIIDDGRNTQNGSALGVYKGKTYIANNLVYDNGGRGIHCYESDKVIIVNNTCFHNCQSPAVRDGEYTAYDTDSITFINNIAYPSPGIPPIDKSSTTTTNLTVDHNLWASNAMMSHPFGTNTVAGLINFVTPSIDHLIADFHLRPGSAGIRAGTHNYSPLVDKDGNSRLPKDSVDIGCYAFIELTGIGVTAESNNLINVYPNPALNLISIKLKSNFEREAKINIFDSKGLKVRTINIICVNGTANFSVSDLNEGLYILQVNYGGNHILTGKFVKTN